MQLTYRRRREEGYVKKRNKCVSVCAALLLALVISGTAAWCESDSDSASVSLTIDPFVDVEVGDIYDWGQGLLSNGAPNCGLNGEDPFFVGGTLTDVWPNDATVRYSAGATGRATVKVACNSGKVTVQIKNGGHYPVLSDGAAHTLLGRATLGWDFYNNGNILPGDFRPFLNLYGYDSSTWLYVCVERKGLDDVAGTYTYTSPYAPYTVGITVEALAL